jgi:hypothetical protein
MSEKNATVTVSHPDCYIESALRVVQAQVDARSNTPILLTHLIVIKDSMAELLRIRAKHGRQ